MLDSVVDSGNGQSAKTAIEVISVREEYAFLASINAKVESQAGHSVDDRRFDILDVLIEDCSPPEARIWFDVTIPKAYLKKKYGPGVRVERT